MTTPRSILLLTVALSVLVPVACSSNTDQGAKSTESTASTVTTTDKGPGSADAALAFFRQTEADCATYAERTSNPVVPSSLFEKAKVIGPSSGPAWLIEDGEGNQLVVNPVARVIHSVDGPSGVLPQIYSFGCPESVYLGSAAD